MAPANRINLAQSDRVYEFSLFTALFFLNAFLVSPFIGWYDQGEMTAATACLGVSHPSGQVLFHLLGKIFLLCPFGSPVFRLGLMSVFFSASAAVLFWRLGVDLAFRLSGEKAPSESLKRSIWLLTLVWALSRPWWTYSLLPLVYALHLFLGFFLLWALHLRKPRKWLLVFFILGAAGVFRPTQWFAFPFLALIYFKEWKKGGFAFAKNSIWVFTAFCMGVSTALYLPLRSALHPAVDYADLTRWLPFVKQVLALRFSKFVGSPSPGTAWIIFRQMMSRYFWELTPLGLGMVLSGLFWAKGYWRRLPDFFWMALGWGAAEFLVVLQIPYPVLESHQILLGWAFSGFAAVPSVCLIQKWAEKDWLRRAMAVLILGLMVLVQWTDVGRLWDRKKERGAQDYAADLLAVMAPNALYVPAEENEYFPLVGVQQSLGRRLDIEVVEPGSDPKETGIRVQSCLKAGRPLYVTRKWDLPPAWAFRAEGPLWRVVPAAWKNPTRKDPLAQPLFAWGKVGLTGVDVDPSTVPAGGILAVTYHWVRSAPSFADQTRTLVVLLVDDRGQYWTRDGIWSFQDIHDLPAGYFTGIKPGFVADEKRILFIPSDFLPGRYHLVVGLQKEGAGKEEGREAYDREFYERDSAEDFDKFMGRGEKGAVVQFKPEGSGYGTLWPLTRWKGTLADSRFAPAALVTIVKPED